jgi:hypothetical protein
MDWEPLRNSEGLCAHGERTRSYYAITVRRVTGASVAGVRLTRWPEETPYHDPYEQGAAAARNLIDIPLGRAGGRPASDLEIAALLGTAEDMAEAYEEGKGIAGYREWPPAHAHRLREGDPVAAPVMLYTGQPRRRFACSRCQATVFTKPDPAVDEYTCNGCGTGYEAVGSPSDVRERNGSDGCRNC